MLKLSVAPTVEGGYFSFMFFKAFSASTKFLIVGGVSLVKTRIHRHVHVATSCTYFICQAFKGDGGMTSMFPLLDLMTVLIVV